MRRAPRSIASSVRCATSCAPATPPCASATAALWIIGGGTTLEGARALGRRLANAAAGAGTLGGAPLEASVGIAVSPDDGTDAASLVAHADEGVFAARAAGVDLA